MRTSPVLAVMWDESHLWGLLLLHALKALRAPFVLLRAGDIGTGRLRALAPATLVMPGGWARLKSVALGEEGRREIREYVAKGGNYLGFCGGAGLALGSEGGTPCLDLCSWSRKAASRRLPNFSGHLRCAVREAGQEYEAALPVWWPSQFEPDQDQPLEVVASYAGPDADFWSADLEWSGITPQEAGRWEELYGINLDPQRLRGEPCIVRGKFGRGRFVLSYAHLETPDSPQANALLARLLGLERNAAVPAWDLSLEAPLWPDPALDAMRRDLSELIAFGQGHFLLSWRTPWLLGWRRGVPGSPLNFLLAMVWQARHAEPTPEAADHWTAHGGACRALCREFCGRARQYLLEERRILATSPSSPESSASPSLQRSKQELFGKFPGYGGLYGEILQTLDEVLWLQLRLRDGGPDRP